MIAPLSKAESDALRAFIAEFNATPKKSRVGRDWKEALSICWYRASRPGVLQQIRNNRGPAWLDSFDDQSLLVEEIPTWHVVIDTESKILGTYPGENLSAAQEFARRTSAQAGEPVARVEQVRDWVRPRVGDLFKVAS